MVDRLDPQPAQLRRSISKFSGGHSLTRCSFVEDSAIPRDAAHQVLVRTGEVAQRSGNRDSASEEVLWAIAGTLLHQSLEL